MEGANQEALREQFGQKCLRTSEGTFLLLQEIGSGSYGRVFLAVHSSTKTDHERIPYPLQYRDIQSDPATGCQGSGTGNQRNSVSRQAASASKHGTAERAPNYAGIVAVKMVPRSAVTRHTLAGALKLHLTRGQSIERQQAGRHKGNIGFAKSLRVCVLAAERATYTLLDWSHQLQPKLSVGCCCTSSTPL